MTNRTRPAHVTAPPAWPDHIRTRALDLADAHGPAEAARIMADDGHHVPPGTIRRWRHDTGRTNPPAGTDPMDWATAKRDAAVQVWDTAQAALAQCRKLIDDGDLPQAKAAAVTLGVLLDKAAMLETAAANAVTPVTPEALVARIMELDAQLPPPPTDWDGGGRSPKPGSEQRCEQRDPAE